ncbi:Protein nedd1 [Chytriomyces hyalinus]|nr:Protein nedd1 [Chytriomyces hyalinus]
MAASAKHQTQPAARPAAAKSGGAFACVSAGGRVCGWRIAVARVDTLRTGVAALAVDDAAPLDVVWTGDGAFLAHLNTNRDALIIKSALQPDASVEVVSVSAVLTAHANVSCFAFGPRRSSRFLYVGSSLGVAVWDRQDMRVVNRFIHPLVVAIALNVDETHLCTAASDGSIRVHSLRTNTTMNLQSPLKQAINKCAFSPFKKSTVAAVGDEGTVVVWDFIHSMAPAFVVKNAHVSPIHGLAWSPCNKSLFATAALDKRVHVYNKDENGKVLLKFEADAPVTSLSVNDDFVIAVGTMTGKVTLFDVRTRKSTLSFLADVQGEAIVSLAFEPPQWAKETSHRDQGGQTSSNKLRNTETLAATTSIKAQTSVVAAAPISGPEKVTVQPGSQKENNLTESGSPVVAAFKERMAAVKEKQSGLMELFSPVKPAFRQDSTASRESYTSRSSLSSELGGTLPARESRPASISSIATSSLREVVTAVEGSPEGENASDNNEEDYESTSESFSQSSPLMAKGRFKSGARSNSSLDMLSSLPGTKTPPLQGLQARSASPLSSLGNSETSLLASKTSTQASNTGISSAASTSASMSSIPSSLNSTARLTDSHVARLQNALNQLKSKSPSNFNATIISTGFNGEGDEASASKHAMTTSATRSPTPTGLNGNNKSGPVPPVLSYKQPSPTIAEMQPPSIIPSFTTSTRGDKSSPQVSDKKSSQAKQSIKVTTVVLKNLPGVPGQHEPQVHQSVVEDMDDDNDDDKAYEDENDEFTVMDSTTLPSKLNGINFRTPVEERRENIVKPQEIAADFDIWTSSEVVGGPQYKSPAVETTEFAGVGVTLEDDTRWSEGVDQTAYADAADVEITGPIDSHSTPAAGGFAHKVLEAVLESCLEDFRMQVKEEIQNMHVELLRQFCIQKNEMNELFNAHSPTEALLKEVVRLREENARLRCGF